MMTRGSSAPMPLDMTSTSNPNQPLGFVSPPPKLTSHSKAENPFDALSPSPPRLQLPAPSHLPVRQTSAVGRPIIYLPSVYCIFAVEKSEAKSLPQPTSWCRLVLTQQVPNNLVVCLHVVPFYQPTNSLTSASYHSQTHPIICLTIQQLPTPPPLLSLGAITETDQILSCVAFLQPSPLTNCIPIKAGLRHSSIINETVPKRQTTDPNQQEGL